MFFGLIGVLLSLASFISGRLDARKLHKEDQRRTQLLEKYFDDARKLPPADRPASVKVVTDAINRITQMQNKKAGAAGIVCSVLRSSR